ncbi:MAG: DUF1735 domain-containing protein [Candidatus Cryptobacteroides sp.]|nr:DUF1735 domain-containing protein [Candidatus Cryptobacteroides sp.]
MKNFIKIISAFALGLFMSASCEDNRLEGMCDDQVYFINSGTQVINVSKRDYADFPFTIYKAGIGQTSASVDVVVDEQLLEKLNEENGTSYKLLDENCYTIKETHFDFSAKDVSFSSSIELDGAAIGSFQSIAVKEYVLPLALRSTGNVSEKLGYILLVPVLEK